MPVVHIQMLEGRTVDQKRQLAEAGKLMSEK
jgi:phenylpyruvate tautomerase PptA (4-oxalocrotonate tautomerase family)